MHRVAHPGRGCPPGECLVDARVTRVGAADDDQPRARVAATDRGEDVDSGVETLRRVEPAHHDEHWIMSIGADFGP